MITIFELASFVWFLGTLIGLGMFIGENDWEGDAALNTIQFFIGLFFCIFLWPIQFGQYLTMNRKH